MNENAKKVASPAPGPQRRAWVAPAVSELPKLTELTLQTVNLIPGVGDIGGGGSTVLF